MKVMKRGASSRKPWRPLPSKCPFSIRNQGAHSFPLPIRAAYQFGVKMSDGRKKDLKKNAKKSREAKLNQEMQKINSLLNKRKSGGGGGDQ